jgi:hypothetical protein
MNDLQNQNQICKEPYGGASKILYEILEKFPVNGKKVAVLGTLIPWIEAIVINSGAISVTTIEYNKPVSELENFIVVSYDEFIKSDTKYDIIITFSSVEHSGLGRYGDDLNPNGDLDTMNEIYDHLHNNGLLFWGAPVGAEDAIYWNVHRIYGPIRFNMMFKNFIIMEWFGHDSSILSNNPTKQRKVRIKQPFIVAKKIILK